jgi:hypothetical protein
VTGLQIYSVVSLSFVGVRLAVAANRMHVRRQRRRVPQPVPFVTDMAGQECVVTTDRRRSGVLVIPATRDRVNGARFN